MPTTSASTGKFGRLFPSLAPFEPDGTDPAFDNPDVPAGYTYLGQFIDHDITFDTSSTGNAVFMGFVS
jgi:hypothetical protein